MKEILLPKESGHRLTLYLYNTILVFHLMQRIGKFIG